jgi:hypothetical protein
MQPNAMPPSVAIIIPDKNALTVKYANTGYRLKRAKERSFVFVRPGELIGLINALADAHENQEKR